MRRVLPLLLPLAVSLAQALTGLGCAGEDGDVIVPRGARGVVKLVARGPDMPQGAADLAELRQRLAEVEASPYDGLVIDLGLQNAVMRGQPLARAPVEAALETLAGIPFRKLTDNFQELTLSPVTLDWFDDALFATIAANMEAAAGFVGRGRLRGFFVDNQVYGARSFSFPDVGGGRSFAEVEELVAARGDAVMTAALRGFPAATFVVNWGFSELLRQVCVEGQELSTHLYGLYPAFLDGALLAIDREKSGATLVDGYLPAYPTRTPGDFEAYYNLVHARWAPLVTAWRPGITTHWDAAPAGQKLTAWRDDPAIVCPPELYAKLARERPAGFGVMLDYGTGEGRFSFEPAGFARNHFSPAAVEASVRAALRRTDRYVWIWAEAFDRWGSSRVTAPAPPPEYIEALRRAREMMEP